MADASFLYFSFIAGLAAFFAPCSFAILPGYISYYLSRHSKDRDKKANQRFSGNAIQGVIFGLTASLGFVTIFGAAGFAVIAVGQFIKQFIPWIAVITGIALIAIGFMMLFGKKFLFFQMPGINLTGKSEKFGVYLFGIAYAIGSLGCVFPIFLSIAIQGIAYDSLFEGVYTILAYILGISIVMVAVTAATFSAKFIIIRKIERTMPYFRKISALIMVFAGAYMIYYQYLLFR